MPLSAAIDRDLASRDDAIAFLLARIDYERSAMPYDPYRLGLARMRELLDRLGRPEQNFAIVHVAGTKGKGSTSAMLAAVLTAAGHRTGLYTSPHLERLEERLAVDGRPCDGDELVELVRLVRPAVEAMDRGTDPQSSPTFFEITTAMALLHFARRRVRTAVLEVGLGGRLDATNVCTPLVSVITSISFDHTRQLGNTLAEIAGEKAGIVKPGVPVVSGVVAAEPRDVIRRICRQRGCRLIEQGVDFDFQYEPPRHLERGPQAGLIGWRAVRKGTVPFSSNENWDSPPREYPIALPGRHQAANAAVALATLDLLRHVGLNIPEAAVRDGLANLAWPARVEVARRRPTVVIDGAHNVASIDALLETLDESFAADRRWLIFATTQDKDLRGMLSRLLGRFDEVAFTQYRNNPRAVPPAELEALAAELTGRHWPAFADLPAAWAAVGRQAEPGDLVCVTGSFFLAAEIRRLLADAPVHAEN